MKNGHIFQIISTQLVVLDQEKQMNCLIAKMNYLHAKGLSESKYEFWIKNREDVVTNHYIDPNAFIEFSNAMNHVCDNIDDPSRKRKALIVFDDIMAGIMSNKKF